MLSKPRGAQISPPRIASLLDVIQFPAEQFLKASGLLAALAMGLQHVKGELSAKGRETHCHQLGLIKKLFLHIEMTYSAQEIDHVLVRLDDPKITYVQLVELLESITRRMRDEATQQACFYIPPEDAKYYFNPHPRAPKYFSDRVTSAFPSAVPDLAYGGRAYATELDTACVFHMMRALEHGLRATARALKVKFPGKPGQPPKPIEFQQWGDVIAAIRTKVTVMENKPRSKKRDADLEFYGNAAAQFHFFKSAWRNHVMHSRVSYEHEDAAIVMRHTLEFMEQISKRLKERGA